MSRRSRAAKKGVVAANRHERRGAAWASVPGPVRVGIFATLAALVGVAALLGALFSRGTTTPQRTNTTVDTDPSSAVAAPPMPGSIPGYEPFGPPIRLTLRLFEKGRLTLIDDFPVTMNGCSNGVSTTRWRALVGEVTAAVTSFTDHPEDVDRSDIRERSTARAGLVRTEHQCDQPVFISLTDGIVDVAVEYQAWNASP